MKILFLHPNFPAQFRYLATALARDKQNQVVFGTARKEGEMANVRKILYASSREVRPETGETPHHPGRQPRLPPREVPFPRLREPGLDSTRSHDCRRRLPEVDVVVEITVYTFPRVRKLSAVDEAASSSPLLITLLSR